MGEYDLALKSILTRPVSSVLLRLTGLNVVRWISSELPDVRGQQADLLGETSEGEMLHVELQSTNDGRMAARMLEYAVAIEGRFGRYPRRVVLYVGRKPVRMGDRIEEPDLSFRCPVVDIRELDGAALLESQSLDDNVVAILGRLTDETAVVRGILARIAANRPDLRPRALRELTVLARLRNLVPVVKRETERMPILEDIMDHEIIGPARRQGMEIGRDIGREEGERKVILSLLEERFGPVPASSLAQIEAMGAPELENLARRLLKAGSLEELLG